MHCDTSDPDLTPNRIGFEFADTGYFYVQGSNTSDVMRIGSYGDHSAIKLFINNSFDAAYNIGVFNASDPTFYIARADAAQPTFYIRGSDGNIGIGTSTPEYTLDVWGTMRVENLISDSISLSNVVGGGISTSNAVLQDIISISGSNGIINVSNSSLSNIQNVVVNSNLTVHDLVVQDSAYIGGDLELHGVYRQVMGRTQKIYASIGQIIYSSSNLTELGFILSWAGTSNAFEFLEVTSDLYAVGCSTRFSLEYKKYVNPIDSAPSFPGEDFSSSVRINKTSNVTILHPYIARHTSNSVRVGAQWKLQNETQHNASMNLNVFAPMSIGNIGLTGYQVLSNLLSSYDMGIDTFINPIENDAYTLGFNTNTYINGIVRYTHGNMQRVIASIVSDTNNAIFGFVIKWDIVSTDEILYIRGKSFSAHGASEFTKWVLLTAAPYNDIIVSVFESYLGSGILQIARLSDTSMRVSILQDATNASYSASMSLEVVASTRIGNITCSAYRTSTSSITRYYNPTTDAFTNESVTYLAVQDVIGVVRNTIGYMETIQVSVGDVLFTTQENNELGFIMSWTKDCYHNMFEVSGLFTANDEMKLHVIFKEMVMIDNHTAVEDIVPVLLTQNTDDVLSSDVFVSPYGVNAVKITIRWTVHPSVTQHRANLALRIVVPTDLGVVHISGVRVANNVLAWYNDTTNTFTASALAPLSPSGTDTRVIRQQMGGMQRITVIYGNIPFRQIYTNKIGYRVSWPNNVADTTIHTEGSFLAHGATTRIVMDFSSVVHIPDVQNSTTVYVTKLQSDNVPAPVLCNLIASSAMSFETYLQWTLHENELHYGTLQMEFIAPMALGELQITGFYEDW